MSASTAGTASIAAAADNTVTTLTPSAAASSPVPGDIVDGGARRPGRLARSAASLRPWVLTAARGPRRRMGRVAESPKLAPMSRFAREDSEPATCRPLDVERGQPGARSASAFSLS